MMKAGVDGLLVLPALLVPTAFSGTVQRIANSRHIKRSQLLARSKAKEMKGI